MLEHFTDPVLRGPTLSSIWMGLGASLVGVLVYLRKRCLIGEALSHATYPGVTLAVLLAALGLPERTLGFLILLCAFTAALIGYGVIAFLQKKMKMSADAALCFVLATFFGLGITIGSYVQFTKPASFRQIQVYLYGQAATMSDEHILLYGGFALAVIAMIVFFYKELQLQSFDSSLARAMGLAPGALQLLSFVLVALTIVLGIRTVGVVLMSAMLIAPPVAARQFTSRLPYLFAFAGLFGMLSGFLGNYLSVALSGDGASLPTGPMIVLVASFFAMGALLFAPERGLMWRYFRILLFRWGCLEENLLKTLWRRQEKQATSPTFVELSRAQLLPRFVLRLVTWRLQVKKWLSKDREGHLVLTLEGQRRGARIVRLHRLWEVYLVDYLGASVEKVHKSAEEMEHILTSEIERELTALLDDPKQDPHQQPIPSQAEVMNHG